jgi:hypothetical protein
VGLEIRPHTPTPAPKSSSMYESQLLRCFRPDCAIFPHSVTWSTLAPKLQSLSCSRWMQVCVACGREQCISSKAAMMRVFIIIGQKRTSGPKLERQLLGTLAAGDRLKPATGSCLVITPSVSMHVKH